MEYFSLIVVLWTVAAGHPFSIATNYYNHTGSSSLACCCFFSGGGDGVGLPVDSVPSTRSIRIGVVVLKLFSFSSYLGVG